MYVERLCEIERANKNTHVKKIKKDIEILQMDNSFWKAVLNSFSENDIKTGLEDEIDKTMQLNDRIVDDSTNLYRAINKQNYEISTLKKKILNARVREREMVKKKIFLKGKKNNSDVIFKLKKTN